MEKINTENVASLDCIIGYERQKEELKEITDFFLNKTKYLEKGIYLPKGILLIGKPGTGKTLFSKVLINECKANIVIVDDFYSKENRLNIHNIYEEARKASPSIVVFDEIDKIINDGKIYRSILIELDGIHDNDNVLTLGMTNARPHQLPASLIRKGRFDRMIRFRYPKIDERKAMFEYFLKNYNCEQDINTDQIARFSSGSNGADIKEMVNDSAFLAIRKNRENITNEDLINAVQRAGCEITDIPNYSDTSKRILAFHEVGHYIIIKHFGLQDVECISIKPGYAADSFVKYSAAEKKEIMTKDNYFINAVVGFAGRECTKIFLKKATCGNKSDNLFSIDSLRKSLINEGLYGYEYCLPSESLKQEVLASDKKYYNIDKKIAKLSIKAQKTCKRILKTNRATILQLTDRLIKEELLQAKDLINVVVK